MMDEFEHPKNQDFLQNIEFIVISFYRQNPELTDHNVDKVYEGLMRVYQKEVQGKAAPRLRFTDLEQSLYENVREIVEFRLGRGGDSDVDIPTNTLDDAIAAMKRLRSSIKTWTGNVGGRRGYLDYIANFIA